MINSTKLFKEAEPMKNHDLPLLLLDNSSMSTVINEGEFKSEMMSFEETKAIIEMYEEGDIIRCFTGDLLEEIIYKYLDIQGQHFEYKKITDMRAGQHAIVFKVYITPSETQPVIKTKYDSEAKKIQNVYVYCQHIVKMA